MYVGRVVCDGLNTVFFFFLEAVLTFASGVLKVTLSA